MRGVFGETVLHVACLFKNFVIARHIAATYEFSSKEDIDKGGLVNAQFTNDRYLGETALILAIVHGDLLTVKFLLDLPIEGELRAPKQKANPNLQCTGNFFREKMYMGGFPLSFAACLGKKDIVDVLLDADAKFSNRDDLYGNTVLHMMVVKGLKDMYDHIFKQCKKRDPVHELPEKPASSRSRGLEGVDDHMLQAMQGDESKKKESRTAERLELITNNENLTPLKLCAKKAKRHLFDHILRKRSTPVWTYGPWEANVFPLEELDSYQNKGKSCLKSCCACMGPCFSGDFFRRPSPGALEVVVYTAPSFLTSPEVNFALHYYCLVEG